MVAILNLCEELSVRFGSVAVILPQTRRVAANGGHSDYSLILTLVFRYVAAVRFFLVMYDPIK